MQYFDFRSVNGRIFFNQHAFSSYSPECSVFPFFKINNINRIRVLFHPRIRVKRMVSLRKILEVKCIQMPSHRVKFIPDAKEFNIPQLSFSHVSPLQFFKRRKIVRKRGTVFPGRRIPDVIVRKKSITCARFMFRLFMKINRPYFPLIIKVQNRSPVRGYFCFLAPVVVKSVEVPVIFRIRKPVGQFPRPVDIFTGSGDNTPCRSGPRLFFAKQTVSVVFCILHPPKHRIPAFSGLPHRADHVFSLRHNLRQFFIPALENISLAHGSFNFFNLFAYIFARPSVYWRNIAPLRVEHDPVIKKPFIEDLLFRSAGAHIKRHILPFFFLIVFKIFMWNIYNPAGRRG